MRFAGDSVTLADIPLTVSVVGTYGNGTYATTRAQVEERFPHSRYGWARIDATGANPDTCNALDIEPSDATPNHAPAWLERYHVLHPLGPLPVLYVDRSNLQAVVDDCTAAGFRRGVHFGLWVATLDGTEYPHAEGDGIVATQWKGEKQTGGHWDQSIIYDPHIWLPVSPSAGVWPPVPAAVLAAMGVISNYIETGAP